MKLNAECVRDVLLAVEDKPFGNWYNEDTLYQKLEGNYPIDDIVYCCIKLKEAGYLEATIIPILGTYKPGLKSVHELTFEGHEFLENIRPPDIWQKTKEHASKIGSYSLRALASIAQGIVTSGISGLLSPH